MSIIEKREDIAVGNRPRIKISRGNRARVEGTRGRRAFRRLPGTVSEDPRPDLREMREGVRPREPESPYGASQGREPSQQSPGRFQLGEPLRVLSRRRAQQGTSRRLSEGDLIGRAGFMSRET